MKQNDTSYRTLPAHIRGINTLQENINSIKVLISICKIPSHTCYPPSKIACVLYTLLSSTTWRILRIPFTKIE